MRLAACATGVFLALCGTAAAAELEFAIREAGGGPIEDAVVWLDARDAMPASRRAAQTEIRQLLERHSQPVRPEGQRLERQL